jgi:CHAT domain-containing protein
MDFIRISYAPNAQLWAICRDRARSASSEALSTLIVGNPLPLPPGAIPLKGAAEEARIINKIWACVSGEVTCFESMSATRTAVLDALRLASSSLTHVHFACHAQANLREPLQSGLLLSGGERLTAGDLLEPGLMHMDRLRLAVLSACQTGVLGTDLPDEVMGLPTGWLEAGAAGVVASLWPVSDEASVALMGKFYELLLLDRIEPDEALWLAQRWLRGLSTWRQDFEQAGATHAAEGSDAVEVTRGMASALGFGRIRLGRSKKARWDSPVHWAAFAMYGS